MFYMSKFLFAVYLAFGEGEKDTLQTMFHGAKGRLVHVGILALRLIMPLVFAGLIISNVISKAPPERVLTVDAALLQADRFIFGLYPMFWLYDAGNAYRNFFEATEPFFIESYNALTLVVGVVLIFLFFYQRKKIRVFILAFCINLFIALPLWYIFPALGPDAFYARRHTGPYELEVEKALDRYHPNRELALFIDKLQSSLEIPEVTAMPSMHAAWGVTAALFAYGLNPLFGAAVWMWNVASGIGSLYLLQHYIVDLLIGAVLAFISYFLARRVAPAD